MRKNLLWSSSGALFKTMCNWLMTVLVVRLSTGFDEAGVLALAMSISNFVFPIAEYRLRTVQVTDVRGEATSREYLGLRILTSLAAVIIGIVYSLATTSVSSASIIIMYVVSQVLVTYLEGFHATEQVAKRMDYIGISYILQGAGGLIAFVVGYILLANLRGAVLLFAVANIIVAIAYDIPRAKRFGSIRPTIRWTKAGLTLLKLLPLATVNTALSVVTLVPRQYLSAHFGEDALGIYASVAAPAVIIQACAGYIYTPLLGHFVETFMTNRGRALRMFGQVALLFVALGLLAAAGFWIAGDWLLSMLFGADILPHTDLIQPVLLFSLITAFVWFVNDLLLGLRDYLGCLLGGLVAVAATLVITPAVTDHFGLNGPSIVGIVASVVTLAVMGVFLARHFGGNTRMASEDPETTSR